MRRKDYTEAVRRFEAAIDLDARAVPAYLNLGDVRVAQGKDQDAAGSLGEARSRWRPIAPTWRSTGSKRWRFGPDRPSASRALCRRLIDDNPQDWRARLALSRHLAASGRAQEALDLQFAALVQNPHALSIHQAIWRALAQLHHPASLVDRYSELTQHAVFYLDPTSACDAATGARSCSGSARTATTGTRSWRSGSRPRRTRPKSRSSCRRPFQ